MLGCLEARDKRVEGEAEKDDGNGDEEDIDEAANVGAQKGEPNKRHEGCDERVDG